MRRQQLTLGFKPEPSAEALRRAFDACHVRKSFQEAMQDPALSLCIKNVARGIDRRMRRHGRAR